MSASTGVWGRTYQNTLNSAHRKMGDHTFYARMCLHVSPG